MFWSFLIASEFACGNLQLSWLCLRFFGGLVCFVCLLWIRKTIKTKQLSQLLNASACTIEFWYMREVWRA